MDNHGVDPGPYLTDVHDISMEALQPDPVLAQNIADLPGRKIVYTNGSEPYARRVLGARGLEGVFDAVYGIEHARFRPKPERAAFDAVFARDGIDPTTAAMFEDDARNLEAPHHMGMRTIHVAEIEAPHPFIHHHTDDLGEFLGALFR
jgi:putative hydrolase of the HAD superfamily